MEIGGSFLNLRILCQKQCEMISIGSTLNSPKSIKPHEELWPMQCVFLEIKCMGTSLFFDAPLRQWYKFFSNQIDMQM